MQHIAAPLERRNGLDGFQLKLLALVIMTIDHIYYFGSSLTVMPEILTLIGRIAAPIFVFFVTEGFAHTHSRGRYLLRLYVCGVLMQFGNLLVNLCFRVQNGVIVINGIFTTMAVIVIYLWWIENMRKAWREHRRGCAVWYALAMAGLFLSFLPISMLMQVSPPAARLAIIFVPSPIYCEGSYMIVLVGIGFFPVPPQQTGAGCFLYPVPRDFSGGLPAGVIGGHRAVAVFHVACAAVYPAV